MKRKLLALFFICSISVSYAVDTATVIFQNGIDGYSGCDDAAISSQSGTNQGGADKLNVKYEKCTT